MYCASERGWDEEDHFFAAIFLVVYSVSVNCVDDGCGTGEKK